MIMKFIKTIPVITLMAVLTAFSASQSMAQILQDVEFTMMVEPELEIAMYDALEEEIAPMKEQIGSSPWLSFAFVDLNYDGKDEILVNVQDEYILVDDYGNTYVHGFAQTSRGLIKIFESPAQYIRLEPSFDGKLQKIHVYKRPNIREATVFVWDGQRQYVEQEELEGNE